MSHHCAIRRSGWFHNNSGQEWIPDERGLGAVACVTKPSPATSTIAEPEVRALRSKWQTATT